MGIYDSSLIAIVSDHGELFNEHGFTGHNYYPYEGVVRVPLLIKFPFQKITGRQTQWITLSDLYSMVLSYCGLPLPRGRVVKTFDGAVSPVVSEFYNKQGTHRAVYQGKYKYMTFAKSGGAELYDLEKDPLEQKNLVQALPGIALQMQTKLKDWKTGRMKGTEPDEVIYHEKVVDGLRALGYIK